MPFVEASEDPTEPPWDVVVVGAGAAGLVAAFHAAERGRRVLLLEKNRKAGAKILMSGGTRCNLTHATDVRGILRAFGPTGRFLRSALGALGPRQVVEMFEAEGVATKVEPTGKIFPASDKALDVLGGAPAAAGAERVRAGPRGTSGRDRADRIAISAYDRAASPVRR